MKQSLILTLISQDKPGLVELVATTLGRHQANWHQSSMSRLAGQFAGILIATVDGDRADALTRDLEALATQGLKVMIESDQAASNEPRVKPVTLDLVGHDQPGIVSQISRILAAHGVSVERLETALVSGSMSAEELFKAEADLRIPADLDMDRLQDDLEAIASDLMVDISLKG